MRSSVKKLPRAPSTTATATTQNQAKRVNVKEHISGTAGSSDAGVATRTRRGALSKHTLPLVGEDTPANGTMHLFSRTQPPSRQQAPGGIPGSTAAAHTPPFPSTSSMLSVAAPSPPTSALPAFLLPRTPVATSTATPATPDRTPKRPAKGMSSHIFVGARACARLIGRLTREQRCTGKCVATPVKEGAGGGVGDGGRGGRRCDG